jgi:hypothetical protein
MAVELLRSWAVAVGVEGATMFGFEFIVSELKKQSFMVQVIKTLKHYTDAVLGIAISAISIAVAAARMPEFAVRAVRVIGSYGVYKTLNKLTRREPSVVLTDTSTISVINLDPNKTVEVWVDGSKVSFVTASTTDTTDGNGNATITLPSALAAGTHKVMVNTGFKAAFVEQYIS